MYKIVDYRDEYDRIMAFNKNKSEPIHRWYPFVEGYSKEFISHILNELKYNPKCALDPFAGSGTTIVEFQKRGIKCFSFEVNPFMYLLSQAKLIQNVNVDSYEQALDQVKFNRELVNPILNSNFKTLYFREGLKKWNYHKESLIAILKLKEAINLLHNDEVKRIFLVVLASIILDSSNLYRNGKCLSYKKNWRENIPSASSIFSKFDDKVINMIIPDLESITQCRNIQNIDTLFLEDCRVGILDKIDDESIDIVITSPPYLNSRDYTDTYMLELKILDFVKNNQDIKEIRNKTIRSHVQIKWLDNNDFIVESLSKTINQLRENEKKHKIWNKSIIPMVNLYFKDIFDLFNSMHKKMVNGGRIYFNVSNSAYYGVQIDNLNICADIASIIGFKVIEIREARDLKPSPQQRKTIKSLLEGVIVIEK